jgi:hypothetical protein
MTKMATIEVPKSKFKIFRKKPSYGKYVGETANMKTFTYTTNNPKGLRGVVPKKGVRIIYR